jgi:hypothetical protein
MRDGILAGNPTRYRVAIRPVALRAVADAGLTSYVDRQVAGRTR